MEKSETVSKVCPSGARNYGQSPSWDMLPFSGLGFDLQAVLTAGTVVRPVGPMKKPAVAPRLDTPFPSGRRLLISLGREIRGR